MDLNFSYIFHIFFLFFLFLIDKKQKKTHTYIHTAPKVICIISYFLFWGLRGFIGTDFSWYYPYFNNLSDGLINAFGDKERIEPGFVIYTYLFKHIWNDYHAFIAFSTGINIIFLHIIFKKLLKKYYILGYIIFIAFCANLEFNNLRNIRSILLLFISLNCIVKKDWKSFFCINLIGLSFHSTAIFYFPLYFILNKNWKPILLPGVIIGFLLVIFQLNILTTIIQLVGSWMGGIYAASSLLFTSDLTSNGFSAGAITRFILGIFLWKVYKDINEPIYRIYANLTICYLFCFSFFNEIPVFRLRFSLMFAISLCITIPYLYIRLNKKYKLIYLIFICLTTLSQSIVNFQGPLFRYDNILWNYSPYEYRMNILNTQQ